MSSVVVSPPSKMAGADPLPVGTHVQSASGRHYLLEEVIYEREWSKKIIFRLYRASFEGAKYILKDIIPGDFQKLVRLHKLVDDSPHVRTLVDTIPDRNMFVFPHRETSLLHHAGNKTMSPATKKKLLRSALTGLADLHDKGIYHGDIKPNNIMMDSLKLDDGSLDFHNVQITDLENAVVLPEGTSLTDRLSGSDYWRSPEAWARTEQRSQSDMFSFGIVAIFLWTDGMMVLYPKKAERPDCPPEELAALVLRCHLSYFGDLDGNADFRGFLEFHDGEDAFLKTINQLLDTFDEANPRRPFHEWTNVDSIFKDLIGRMTCLDPRLRISAREALQHPWFAQ